MSFLGKLFGSNAGPSATELLSQGALIIDVRSPGEYAGGHIKGSKNIPLPQIGGEWDSIKKLDQPIVFCCASGMRSGRATSMAKKQEITCANGGSWSSLRAYGK